MNQRMIHPGPRAAERAVAVPASLRRIGGVLPAGRTVMTAVARLFADAGCKGGVVWLDGVTCDPMRYVLPALSSDAAHAAWYSNTHAPEGPVRIETATASVGRRDVDEAAQLVHSLIGSLREIVTLDWKAIQNADVRRGFIDAVDVLYLTIDLDVLPAATAPGVSYLHQWKQGDVVMWDNRATMHRGRPWPAHEGRLMIRTTISATDADGVAILDRFLARCPVARLHDRGGC